MNQISTFIKVFSIQIKPRKSPNENLNLNDQIHDFCENQILNGMSHILGDLNVARWLMQEFNSWNDKNEDKSEKDSDEATQLVLNNHIICRNSTDEIQKKINLKDFMFFYIESLLNIFETKMKQSFK